MFEPEPEPGDRWRWIVFGVVGVALVGVLRWRAFGPVVLLVEGAIGVVLLVLVVAALLRLLR